MVQFGLNDYIRMWKKAFVDLIDELPKQITK